MLADEHEIEKCLSGCPSQTIQSQKPTKAIKNQKTKTNSIKTNSLREYFSKDKSLTKTFK